MAEQKKLDERAVAVNAEETVEAEVVSRGGQGGGREVYNVVTDVVIGPNLRWKDNVYQAVTIVICTLLGALMAWWVWRGPGEALAGAFCGLLVGLFGSGIFLMVYRAVRHARGRHD